MKKNLRSPVIVLFALALIAGAGMLAWNHNAQLHQLINSDGGQAPNASSAAALSTTGSGIGDSSQKVEVSVVKGDHDHDAEVTLHIRTNWHVNANPASLDYLIPTTISVEQNGKSRPAAAQYPPGVNSGIRIDEKDLQLYEDGTRIPVSGLPSLTDSRLMVRVQACSSEGVCLPPANIAASINTP